MTRRLLLFSLLLTSCVTHRSEERAEKLQIVECGTDKVVLFEGTESPDKRYALGWTVRPLHEGEKPVDWSSWSGTQEDMYPFLFRHPSAALEIPDPPYELINAVVDLKTKRMLRLTPWPWDTSYWPGKNHADLNVRWSATSGESRHALIQNEARFGTFNLWLVTLEGDRMRQMDLKPRLDVAVKPLIRKTHPAMAHEYSTSYELLPDPLTHLHKGAAFHRSSVDIPFLSDLPKAEAPDSLILGKVTLHLPDGAVKSVATVKAP